MQRRPHSGVAEALEDGLHLVREVGHVHVVDGVVERPEEPEGARRLQRGPVLDVAPLGAVVPVHAADPVVRPGRRRSRSPSTRTGVTDGKAETQSPISVPRSSRAAKLGARSSAHARAAACPCAASRRRSGRACATWASLECDGGGGAGSPKRPQPLVLAPGAAPAGGTEPERGAPGVPARTAPRRTQRSAGEHQRRQRDDQPDRRSALHARLGARHHRAHDPVGHDREHRPQRAARPGGVVSGAPARRRTGPRLRWRRQSRAPAPIASRRPEAPAKVPTAIESPTPWQMARKRLMGAKRLAPPPYGDPSTALSDSRSWCGAAKTARRPLPEPSRGAESSREASTMRRLSASFRHTSPMPEPQDRPSERAGTAPPAHRRAHQTARDLERYAGLFARAHARDALVRDARPDGDHRPARGDLARGRTARHVDLPAGDASPRR